MCARSTPVCRCTARIASAATSATDRSIRPVPSSTTEVSVTVTTTLGLGAAVFGIAMGLSPLLQVRHMVARGSSADVSLPFLVVLLAGFVLWLAYRVALGNAALIVSNAVTITSYAITTAAVLRLR
jgi:uncharacterized protein with PQ loop repeat